MYARTFLAAAILLSSLGLTAQEPSQSKDHDLLVRLSYQSSPVVKHDGIRRICVSVSRDGDYRVVRLPQEGQFQRLQGKMSGDQLRQLKALLSTDEFKALSGSHGGLIRQDAESFGAEIPLTDWQGKDSSQRLQWLNADGDNPFPTSVAKVVDWLRHFEPADAKSFVYSEYPDVCPSSSFRLLQPTVAANQHR